VPATKTHGAERIHDIVALHAAFTTNNTVGDIVWAEK
jgi:hypothetical protein